MVRTGGSRILGYESGFDSYGRGLDALAEAGDIKNRRKREAESDQQGREEHAKALEFAALRIKALEDELGNRAADRKRQDDRDAEDRDARAAASKRADADLDLRRRDYDDRAGARAKALADDEAGDDAFSKALAVAGGQTKLPPRGAGSGPTAPSAPVYPPMDGRGPVLGIPGAIPGDTNGDGVLDEEEAAHLDETERIFSGLASIKGLRREDAMAVLGSRKKGLDDITKRKALRLIDGMFEAGTLDETKVQDARQLVETGAPEDVVEGIGKLEAVHKASKERAADVNLRTSAMTKTDEMIASLPGIGVVLTPEQEQEIEDLRQDIADPTVPTTRALAARDKIREIALGGASKSKGSAAKAWHDSPAFLKILELKNGDVAGAMKEARVLGISGMPAEAAHERSTSATSAPQSGTQVPREALAVKAQLEQTLGRTPTREELAAALKAAAEAAPPRRAVGRRDPTADEAAGNRARQTVMSPEEIQRRYSAPGPKQ